MKSFAELADDLEAHRKLCEGILALAERESASLNSAAERPEAELGASKKKFLAQLARSLDKIREHRIAWSRLEPAIRQGYPEIAELLRENQNLIMRILVIDRENEKGLLRKGLVPNKQIPSAARQQPHFVANLYRRNSYA